MKQNINGPNVQKSELLFSQNEYLAVRNAEDSYFLCICRSDVYQSTNSFSICWLDNVKDSQADYVISYMDNIELACVLTKVELVKKGKRYKLNYVEQHRVEDILKESLNAEKELTLRQQSHEAPSLQQNQVISQDTSLQVCSMQHEIVQEELDEQLIVKRIMGKESLSACPANTSTTEESQTITKLVSKKNQSLAVESSINQRPRRKIKHKFIKSTRESPVKIVNTVPEVNTQDLESTETSEIVTVEPVNQTVKLPSTSLSQSKSKPKKQQNRNVEKNLRRSVRQNRSKDSISIDTDESNLQMVEIIDDPSDDPNLSIEEIIETCVLDSEEYERMVNSSQHLSNDSSSNTTTSIAEEQNVNAISGQETSSNSQSSQNTCEKQTHIESVDCIKPDKKRNLISGEILLNESKNDSTFEGVFTKTPKDNDENKEKVIDIKPAIQFQSQIHTRRVTRLSSMCVSRPLDPVFSKSKLPSSKSIEAEVTKPEASDQTDIDTSKSAKSPIMETENCEDVGSNSNNSNKFEINKEVADKSKNAETHQTGTENVQSSNVSETPIDLIRNDELITPALTVGDESLINVETPTAASFEVTKCAQEIVQIKAEEKCLGDDLEPKANMSVTGSVKKLRKSDNLDDAKNSTEKSKPKKDKKRTSETSKQIVDSSSNVQSMLVEKSSTSSQCKSADTQENPSVDKNKSDFITYMEEQFQTSDPTKQIQQAIGAESEDSVRKQEFSRDFVKTEKYKSRKESNSDQSSSVKDNKSKRFSEATKKTDKSSESTHSTESKEKYTKSDSKSSKSSSTDRKSRDNHKDTKSSDVKVKHYVSEPDLQSKKSTKKETLSNRSEKDMALEQLKTLEPKSIQYNKPTNKDSLEKNRDISTKLKIKSSTHSTSKVKSKSKETPSQEPKDEKPNVSKISSDQLSTSRKSQHQTTSHANKNKRCGTDFILSECYLPKQVKYDESLYSIEALKAAHAAQEEQMKADAKAAKQARELLAAKEEQAKIARAAARIAKIEEAKAAERAKAAEITRLLEEAEAQKAAKLAKAAAKAARAKQLKETSNKTSESPQIESYGLFASRDVSQELCTTTPKIEKPHEIVDQNFIPENFKNSPAFVQYQSHGHLQDQQLPNITNIKSDELVIHADEEETNIRRSGRIKTITETKQRSCGFGLVRDKERFHNIYVGDLSYTSMSDSQYLSDYNSSNSNSMIDLSEIEKDSEAEAIIVKKEKTEDELEQERRDVAEGLSLFKQIVECEFRSERTISKETKKMTCDCFLTKSEIERGELGCGEDCLNRLIFIECGSRCAVGDRCTNKRFQKRMNSDCTIFKAGKKGFGMKAASVIPPGEFIMEYVGEVLNSQQFDDRRFQYSNDNIQHHYFMALRSDCVIDATIKGNISRFINHSCDPNAETQKWTVNGELRIGFFSTRTIHPDEEITFDYQFQRYGGWIGEEPDSEDEDEDYDDDEEEEEKEPAIEEEQATLNSELIKEEISSDDNLIKSPCIIQPIENDISEKLIEIATPQTPTKKVKKPKPDQKPKKFKKTEIMEDPDLDHEIANLMETNLKNQAHTLRFSRLMVRAKMLTGRSKLLSILRNGELACRRLFLDYHGLKLLHTWMCDSVTTNVQQEWAFRLDILETLEVLPIPNKNMLQDSKVLLTVRKWASKSPEESASDSGSGTPVSEGNSPQVEDTKNSDSLKNIVKVVEQSKLSENIDSSKEVIDSSKEFIDSNENTKAIVTEQVLNKSSGEECADDELMEQIRFVTSKLLESWDQLKEVFRIPKKLRIEQMKEHEQEANRSYRAFGMTDASDSSKRYNDPSRERDKERFKKEKRNRPKEPQDPDSIMMKAQRRRLFEAKVAQESVDKRNFEKQFEAIHIAKCKYFHLDPRITSYRDMPFSVSPLTGQWYSQDGRMLATPPSHAHIKPPQELPTNPEEYDLPPMDLPDQWKFAIDNKGKLYYYHVKIRIPQWDPPIKILPLMDEQTIHSDDIKTELSCSDDNKADGNDESLSHLNVSNEIESDKEDDSDLESSDAVDSSEDELMQKRQQLVNCFQANQTDLDISANLAVEISAMATTNEKGTADDTDQSLNLDQSSMQSSNKKKNRDGLATERLISPRTDEERLQSKIEMQRYKANKEKMRRRREDAKQRQHSSAEPSRKLKRLTDGLPVVSQQDDEIDETDDEDEANASELELGALNERFVDELDGIKLEKNSNRTEVQRARSSEITRQNRKIVKRKRNEPEPVIYNSTEAAKKIKEKFCAEMSGVIVQHLGPYRKDECRTGRITNNDDFKHLARKLTHFVMLKELKHCDNTVTVLEVTDSVRAKSKEFIRKYMAKFGDVYIKPDNEPEYKEFCNT